MGHPVVPLPETVVCVARRVGIRTARDVVSDENRFRLRQLEPDEHARVAAALRLIRRIRPDVEDYQVLAMDCPPSPDTLGLASRRNRSIYLSTELLRSGCARKLLRTLLEEVAHLESGAGDLERAFEDWCLEFATDTVLATEVS
jgi:hypothetical protein